MATRKTSIENINRLALAIAYYRDMMPADPSRQHPHLLATARRFNINHQLILAAVRILKEGN